VKIESKTREIRLAHYFNFIRIFFSRKKLWVQPKIKITPSTPIVVEKARPPTLLMASLWRRRLHKATSFYEEELQG